MPLPTISLTEIQSLTALRTFLLGVVATGTEVIRGQVNRVPEPIGEDFIVFWPIRQERLETNETTYIDNDFIGSISGTTLTITAVGHGTLAAGQLLLGTGSGAIVTNTTVVEQLTGSVGGTGTYSVSVSQIAGSGIIYSGTRNDLVGVQWTIQIDVHGPTSSDNVRRIDALFRSEYGTDTFDDSGYVLAPLYCGEARMLPFQNMEQQIEYRWVIEAVLQINPTVVTSQQFADALQVDTQVPVDAIP